MENILPLTLILNDSRLEHCSEETQPPSQDIKPLRGALPQAGATNLPHGCLCRSVPHDKKLCVSRENKSVSLCLLVQKYKTICK